MIWLVIGVSWLALALTGLALCRAAAWADETMARVLEPLQHPDVGRLPVGRRQEVLPRRRPGATALQPRPTAP